LKVEVNVPAFVEFRESIFRSFLEESKRRQGNLIKSSKSVLMNPYARMNGLRWQEITIKFVDPESVRIAAREQKAVFSFRDLLCEDSRKRQPDSQWKLLKWLADNHGELSWEDTEASDDIKTRKYLLSKSLKKFFNIIEDPFRISVLFRPLTACAELRLNGLILFIQGFPSCPCVNDGGLLLFCRSVCPHLDLL
jgi:hypothetical protein